MKKSKKDESAEAISGVPSNIQALNGSSDRAANSSLDRIRSYKAVTPVVLKGEDSESGSLLNREQRSSARERLPYDTNSRDNDQLVASGDVRTNCDDVRPPPPPYVEKLSSTE